MTASPSDDSDSDTDVETRFAASTPTDRRELYVDAIAAHRERASPFLTIEADPVAVATAEADEELGIPWIQFANGTLNLDCTDDELDELKAVLASYPAFTIDDIARPADADGINVRVSARADDGRTADCIDELFRRVYGLGEHFRAWVVEV